MAERSSLYKSVEKLMRADISELIRKRREHEYPWSAIAREISNRSGIEISDETVRRWAGETAHEQSAEVA
jgi:hypothetical protein